VFSIDFTYTLFLGHRNTTSKNIFSSDSLLAKGMDILRVGEVIQYYHPFWGWKGKSSTATLRKIEPEDSIPLKLDTRDVLERTHSIRRVKKYVNGELVDCMGEEDWNKVGSYQLAPGQVKDYRKRKSLEAQRLQCIQDGLDLQFQQVAKEYGMPQLVTYNSRKKQKSVEGKDIITLDDTTQYIHDNNTQTSTKRSMMRRSKLEHWMIAPKINTITTCKRLLLRNTTRKFRV
jgi:hypothetical protein